MSDRERGSQKSFQTPEGCMWPHHIVEILMEVEYSVEWVDLHVVREGVKRQESWLDEMKKANREKP